MTIGPLTLERHRDLRNEGIDLHVFYQGEDVTSRCKFADDTSGNNTATLFKVNAQGRKYLDANGIEVAKEYVTPIEIREV